MYERRQLIIILVLTKQQQNPRDILTYSKHYIVLFILGNKVTDRCLVDDIVSHLSYKVDCGAWRE